MANVLFLSLFLAQASAFLVFSPHRIGSVHESRISIAPNHEKSQTKSLTIPRMTSADFKDSIDRRKIISFAGATLANLAIFRIDPTSAAESNEPAITAKVFDKAKNAVLFSLTYSDSQVFIDLSISGRTKALENEKWEKVETNLLIVFAKNLHF
jgi:hypothetical protein